MGSRFTNPFNPNGTLPFQGQYRQKTIPRGDVDGPFPLFNANTVPESCGLFRLQLPASGSQAPIGHGLMLDAFYTWSKELDYSFF